MRDLLFFNPDPNVPDSDLLGFGDLVYSDGTTEYLTDDPELAAQLPRPPPGVSPNGAAGMGPPPPPPGQMPPPVQIDGPNGPMQMDMTGNLRPMEGVQDPNTGELLDPGQPSNFLPQLGQGLGAAASEIGNAAQGYPQPAGQAWEQQMGAPGEAGATPAQMPAVTFMGDQGPVTLDPMGNLKPGEGGIPIEQLQQQKQQSASGGMVPMQREGALDPGIAARQQADMMGMQQQTLQATQQGRADEVRLYNEMTLKQMAMNEAERLKQEAAVQEEQAKVARWQQEQQQVAEMQVQTDLVSARGPIGAVMAALGATLLGAAGNDAGLRMIEKQIDQHVRLQVADKQTKLGMLAEKIGSAQVAIKLGKAALYDATVKQGELLGQKTKADVFEAQTPAVLQGLRQKGLAELQEAERLSLGRTIEKVPPPPAPPNPAMLEKYGALRREREGNDSITQRMDQTLGLVWQPGRNGQPGSYANKAEVLKNGIQGTGNLEQLIPDIVYATGGGVTAEGRQVRGAAEAMAFAQLRAVQPTGPISNSDIERAVKMGALDTEEGLLLGLERMHNAAEEQVQHDAAQYGPDIVGEYERRRGGPQAPTGPVSVRPSTPEEKRGAAGVLRQTQPAAAPQAAAGIPAEPAQRMAQVREDVAALAPELPPEGMAILVAQAAHESGEGDSEGAQHGNMFGHKRSGSRAGFEANTTEGDGSGAKRVKQTFADYPSITDATADHLSLIKRKYPLAWEALEVGDADAYVARLKDGGYFTGNEDLYRKAILRRL